MKKNIFDKPFYLIAEYWLGDLQGFIKTGDNKEEIMKLFEERYIWKPNTLGITEQSFDLLEVNAKVIATDQDIMKEMNNHD